MPVEYEYVCVDCGVATISTKRAGDTFCQICDGRAVRQWGFNPKLSMPDHYNNAVGKYVSNESALTEAFHVQSEAATERTGIPHKFVPVHPQDRETFGITDEGLDATHNQAVESGVKAPVVKLR